MNENYSVRAHTAHERMVNAGADALNAGKPCVPGLDPLWHRELRGHWGSAWTNNLSASWRQGWKAQAALVEAVREHCPHLLQAELSA